MASRVNTSVSRILNNGPGARSTDGQRRQLATQEETPTLERAVVVDIVCDASLLNEDYLNQVANIVDNPELVDVMPVNSILARIVSNQGGLGLRTNTILFPFFSSHFMLPVQPGEQVYVIYEDYVSTGTKIGYWLTRGSSQQTIEDVNYSHYDRKFDPTLNFENYSTSQQREGQRSSTEPAPIAFQNGGNTPDTLTIQPSGSLSEDPYSKIVENSLAGKYITPEPVPRWKKRPQELVLQGANNSLIMLGEDRNGPISGAINTLNKTDINGQAAAIDLVAGRGRFFAQPGINPRGPVSSNNPPGEKNTAPLTTKNSREKIETDKAPFRSGRENLANPLEGNPDPIFDAARVYIAQQSKVDENYNLVQTQGKGQTYPENTLQPVQPAGNGPYGRSYVVNKADNIRIIGRKEDLSGIKGTVLLIREGVPDQDLAYMFMNNEGKIQIESPKIYIGKSVAEAEPYIKWTEFKKTVDHLQEEINSIRNALQAQLQVINGIFTAQNTALASAFSAAIPVPGVAIASLAALALGPLQSFAGQINGSVASEAAKNNTAYSTGKSNTDTSVEKSKSKKIYGE